MAVTIVFHDKKVFIKDIHVYKSDTVSFYTPRN